MFTILWRLARCPTVQAALALRSLTFSQLPCLLQVLACTPTWPADATSKQAPRALLAPRKLKQKVVRQLPNQSAASHQCPLLSPNSPWEGCLSLWAAPNWERPAATSPTPSSTPLLAAPEAEASCHTVSGHILVQQQCQLCLQSMCRQTPLTAGSSHSMHSRLCQGLSTAQHPIQI